MDKFSAALLASMDDVAIGEIESFADLNAACDLASQTTPLLLAIEHVRANVVKAPNTALTRILIEAGADPFRPGHNGETAFDWAKRLKHDAALALIESLR